MTATLFCLISLDWMTVLGDTIMQKTLISGCPLDSLFYLIIYGLALVLSPSLSLALSLSRTAISTHFHNHMIAAAYTYRQLQ